MPTSGAVRLGYLASLVVIVAFCVGHLTVVSAQDGTASVRPPTSRQLPIRHSSAAKLTEQQERGAGLFIQRCALCHLAKTFGAEGSKYCVFTGTELERNV